jgi:hypothetical protein
MKLMVNCVFLLKPEAAECVFHGFKEVFLRRVDAPRRCGAKAESEAHL